MEKKKYYRFWDKSRARARAGAGAWARAWAWDGAKK